MITQDIIQANILIIITMYVLLAFLATIIALGLMNRAKSKRLRILNSTIIELRREIKDTVEEYETGIRSLARAFVKPLVVEITDRLFKKGKHPVYQAHSLAMWIAGFRLFPNFGDVLIENYVERPLQKIGKSKDIPRIEIEALYVPDQRKALGVVTWEGLNNPQRATIRKL